MSDHVLGDGDAVVDFAVVDFESQSDEAGEDGRRAGVRSDWRHLVTRSLGPLDHQAVLYSKVSIQSWFLLVVSLA